MTYEGEYVASQPLHLALMAKMMNIRDYKIDIPSSFMWRHRDLSPWQQNPVSKTGPPLVKLGPLWYSRLPMVVCVASHSTHVVLLLPVINIRDHGVVLIIAFSRETP